MAPTLLRLWARKALLNTQELLTNYLTAFQYLPLEGAVYRTQPTRILRQCLRWGRIFWSMKIMVRGDRVEIWAEGVGFGVRRFCLFVHRH